MTTIIILFVPLLSKGDNNNSFRTWFDERHRKKELWTSFSDWDAQQDMVDCTIVMLQAHSIPHRCHLQTDIKTSRIHTSDSKCDCNGNCTSMDHPAEATTMKVQLNSWMLRATLHIGRWCLCGRSRSVWGQTWRCDVLLSGYNHVTLSWIHCSLISLASVCDCFDDQQI